LRRKQRAAKVAIVAVPTTNFGQGAIKPQASIGDPKGERGDHDLNGIVAAQRTKAKTLQEARMGFEVHPAAVLAVTAAGAMTLAAPDAKARAWRDAHETWGDARLLTSIHLATE
jgi:hypothetical protein